MGFKKLCYFYSILRDFKDFSYLRKYLEHKYKNEPFVVIGVHSAKFENEKDAQNIQSAVDRYEINRDVVALVPKELACRHCIMPLDRVGNVLSLVMLDPLDMDIRADVGQRTNCRVAPFISTRREIEKAIGQCYR